MKRFSLSFSHSLKLVACRQYLNIHGRTFSHYNIQQMVSNICKSYISFCQGEATQAPRTQVCGNERALSLPSYSQHISYLRNPRPFDQTHNVFQTSFPLVPLCQVRQYFDSATHYCQSAMKSDGKGR